MADSESTEVMAYFCTQMLLHVVRNLVAVGALDENVVRTNIQETIDGATEALSAEHHHLLVRMAQSFEEAVASGSARKE